MHHTEQLLKLISSLKDISESNTQHASTLNVILCALITVLDETQKQSLLMTLKRHAEACQDQPALHQSSAAALQHVASVLATPPDKPKPILQVIQGGKTDA